MKEKTLQLAITVKYVADKKNTDTNTLSCYPSLRATLENVDVAEAEDVEMAKSASVIASLHFMENDVIVLDR